MSSSNTNNNPLAKVDVDGIVKRSIRGHIQKSAPSVETLAEAYVHDAKPFKQVTEFVSQKTKSAHTDLYKGYVESLNKVSAELDSVDRGASNPRHSDFRNLKLDETYNLNATWLHELYFSNCFDPNSEIAMDSLSFLRLQRDFGTFDDWQRDFIACGLAAKNGWAVLAYHTFLRRYVNLMIDSHDGNIPVGVYPVIVVDVWEHSYFKDYLTDRKSYLISQMKEFNWEVIEDRFTRAEAIAEAVK